MRNAHRNPSPPRRRPKWPARFFAGVLIASATGGSVAFAGEFYSSRVIDRIDTVSVNASGTQLQAKPGAKKGPTETENYLLVGSDSREGADKNDIDYGGIGNRNEGKRSDTMLILRYDPTTKTSGLLSVPRDLWVVLADTGRKDRVNEAFDRSDPNVRSQNLMNTISQALELPIHHYVEVNFGGFKAMVDAMGGVSIYLDTPMRDIHTGFEKKEVGCVLLDGVTARQYVRSRYMEEFRNGKWHDSGTSDFGRMARQRDFISRAINKAASRSAADPLVSGQLLRAAAENLKKDEALDFDALSEQLRRAGDANVLSFSLPVDNAKISGNDVLLLRTAEAQSILDIFRGKAPMVEPAAGEVAAPVTATPQTTTPVATQATTPVATTVDPAKSCR